MFGTDYTVNTDRRKLGRNSSSRSAANPDLSDEGARVDLREDGTEVAELARIIPLPACGRGGDRREAVVGRGSDVAWHRYTPRRSPLPPATFGLGPLPLPKGRGG